MMLEKLTVTLYSFQLLFLLPTLLAMPNGSESDYHHDSYRGHLYDLLDHQRDTPRGVYPHSKNKSLGYSHENCILDDRWKGKWFQTGYAQTIYIDDKSIGPKGRCLEKAGRDKFLFFIEATNCHRCVVINERHRNILQYKESQYCEDKDLLDNLCSQIPGDGPLYSLFRIEAQPVDCPFKGAPFTFTYNRGHGECRDPLSNIDACTESSRLLLRYQACPNIPKTESTIEELECIAEWKEGSNHYLIGKLDHHLARNSHEERYRCFLYEKIKDHSIIDGEGRGRTIGYRIAQSGDASCTDISSPLDGARALELTKVEPSGLTKCKFPNWMMGHDWHTLDGKLSIRVHSKNSTLYIMDEGKRNSTIFSNNIIPLQRTNAVGPMSLLSAGTRVICQKRLDISDRHISIVAQRTKGCQSESLCLNIYKRDNHVIEIRIKQKSGNDDRDCGNKLNLEKPLENYYSYITLVSSAASQRRCPQFGKYLTTTSTSPSSQARVSRETCKIGGQNSYKILMVDCGHKGTMEFHSICATEEPITSYMCHGNWEESGTGYLIATPLSRSSNSADRYCFIYTQTQGGLRVTRSSESCRINISSGVEGVWAFNLTVDGQCAEPLTGISTSIRAQVISMFTIVCCAIFFILPFQSSSLEVHNLNPLPFARRKSKQMSSLSR